MAALPQPGPVMVALDLHLLAAEGRQPLLKRLFDRNSLAVAETADGKAIFASDFHTDPAGFVRILVLDRGLGPEGAGALVQRIIELETYRTLALLGLPEAQRLSPAIGHIERRLSQVTEEMRRKADLVDNHAHQFRQIGRIGAGIDARAGRRAGAPHRAGPACSRAAGRS